MTMCVHRAREQENVNIDSRHVVTTNCMFTCFCLHPDVWGSAPCLLGLHHWEWVCSKYQGYPPRNEGRRDHLYVSSTNWLVATVILLITMYKGEKKELNVWWKQVSLWL